MTPPMARQEIDDTELQRLETLRNKARDVYTAVRNAGPNFDDDPAGALAWRSGLKARVEYQFDIDMMNDQTAARDHGLTWANIAACLGLDHTDATLIGRLRARQNWRTTTYAAAQTGTIGPEDQADNPNL